ncbi:hypothetical protein G7054_g1166 [Neopestalotiopsis clavispora]|nr:hypothetical protein G7054_g1166 [Neopestalotiopsis clavispora]
MEHIPQAMRSTQILPDVTFYANEYDRGPVIGYLDRIGWTLKHITHCFELGRAVDEVHAVLQTWTYFGILHEFIGTVDIHDFMIKRNDRVVLTTVRLPVMIKDWIDSKALLTHEQQQEEEAHLAKCLGDMKHVYHSMFLNSHKAIDRDFLLSVQLLYDYLTAAGLVAFGRFDETSRRLSPLYPISYTMLGGKELPHVRFLRDGWCPSEISLLNSTASPSELLLASSLSKPGVGKDHSHCSEHKCLAYQVREEEYRTRHTKEDCDCEFVFASQSELASVLCGETGSIPLVLPWDPARGHDGKLHVHLQESGPMANRKPFVAISHVWSDGLGNAEDNAIPLCQFRRLCQLVSTVHGGVAVPFWLDTLCFPLEPQHAYDMALIRMRESYEGAQKVLVLDSYLLQDSCKDLSTYEVVLRIFCSPWNRRLWTLQEGLLARHLAFQFEDTYVDTQSLKTKREIEDPLNKLHNFLFRSTWQSLESLKIAWDGVGKRMTIIEAKKALTYRSTSNPADEPLCLGNLVGVDPAAVVKAKSRNERMKVIWRSLPQQFSEPIFWTGLKIKDQGYRWAAATLMHDNPVETVAEDPRRNSGLRQAPSMPGLSVRLPAIQFYLPNLKVGESFRFYIGSQGPYTGFFNTRDITKERDVGTMITPSTKAGFLIILGPTLIGSLRNDGLNEESSRSLSLSGRLADILGEENNVIRVHSLNKVNFYRMSILTDSTLDLDAPETEWQKGSSMLQPAVDHDQRTLMGVKSSAEPVARNDYLVSNGIAHPDVALMVD